jgi:hypothetical protein
MVNGTTKLSNPAHISFTIKTEKQNKKLRGGYVVIVIQCCRENPDRGHLERPRHHLLPGLVIMESLLIIPRQDDLRTMMI